MSAQATHTEAHSADTAGVARRKQVLFLTHVGEAGGAEYKMIDLCQPLDGAAEVMLLEHGSLELLLNKRHIAYSVCPMPASARNVRRQAGVLGALKAVPAMVGMIRRMTRKARQFDVVVCMSQKSFVLASFAKPFMRRPIFWFMNDILSTPHFSRALIRFVVTLSRFSADHIALNSNASLDAWVRSGGKKARTSIIYPVTQADQTTAQLANAAGIAAHRKRYSPDRKPLIGMFGRISRWKGQDVFLRALAELPSVNAVIAGGAHFGEETYEQHLRQLTRQLGLQPRVAFAGHVDDVVTLMAACDVVAHCSTSPEPFGQVIVQSMFAGTPVVASDGGGVREIVTQGETGQVTPPEDSAALAQAVRRYLENPRWARQIAAEAQRSAHQKFSSAAMVTRFTEILEQL